MLFSFKDPKMGKPTLCICDLCDIQQTLHGMLTPLLACILFNSQLVNFADLQDRFQGHYTNHSLRALAATRLYDARIDEQLITEKTGHRSTSVRSYKRMNEVLQQKSQQDHSWGKG